MCHTKTRLATPCYDEPTVTALTEHTGQYLTMTYLCLTTTALPDPNLPQQTSPELAQTDAT